MQPIQNADIADLLDTWHSLFRARNQQDLYYVTDWSVMSGVPAWYFSAAALWLHAHALTQGYWVYVQAPNDSSYDSKIVYSM